jgi:hypothetical protein
MEQKGQRMLAAAGLAIGAVFGMAGTFASSDTLRGLAWGIDGVSLVMASALLVVMQIRKGQDFLAAGFLIFAIGQCLVLSSAPLSLVAGAPSFGAGVGLWAAGLALVSTPKSFPIVVRLLGFLASILFAIVAVQIFAGVHIVATTSPLPFFAYPVLVGTMIGWIWALLRET